MKRQAADDEVLVGSSQRHQQTDHEADDRARTALLRRLFMGKLCHNEISARRK